MNNVQLATEVPTRPRRRKYRPLTDPATPGAVYREHMDGHEFYANNGLRIAERGNGDRQERDAALMKRTREVLRVLGPLRREHQLAMVVSSMERRSKSWRLAR